MLVGCSSRILDQVRNAETTEQKYGRLKFQRLIHIHVLFMNP